MATGKKTILDLLSKAKTLPRKAGCYLMKNKSNEIIYVGKAKNLKNRVESYFNSSSKSPKTKILVSHITDFEFIITESEVESFVLENNLIKSHMPKYNIRLKDDKSYPYVLINKNHFFPRLEYVRRPKKVKGHELYGPYPTGSNIGNTLRILTKAFKLRDCSDHELKSRTTPCILFQMHQCTAPCVEKIKSKEYLLELELAINFLKGQRKASQSLEVLKMRMSELAEIEKFEEAAMLRDYIFELEKFMEHSYDQNVEFLDDKNVDIISYFEGEEEVDISLYMIRSGALLGHKNFHFPLSDFHESVENEIIQILLQYYSKSNEIIPQRIITSLNKEYSDLFSHALESIEGESSLFKIETNSKKYESLIEATKNHAKESQRVRIENEDSVYVGLHRLKELLKLKDRPRTLECYDIAIWQGKSPTAAQIVYHDGVPDKKSYRNYHLEERPEGNNDFAMMKEVFSRRLKKGNLPDVFIVDGGIQQVNTVKKVLEEFNIETPVVGIAKARDLTSGNLRSSEISKSEERLIIQGRANPYILNKCQSLFKIIVSMRDEAHRFSRRLHHKTEKKRIIKSWVFEIKGIGEDTKNHILQNLSLDKKELKKMTEDELKNFFGIEKRHAKALFNYLHAKTKN